MAYVGTPLDTTNAFQSLAGKRFNGDGSTTAFTLDSSPNSTLDIEVFVGNVRQDPNSAYTISGTTLTFTGAPPSGTNNIYVVHQAKSVGTIDVPSEGVQSGSLSSAFLTGQTDIGGAIADADLFLVDDGAGGTFRKTAASRLKTYAGFSVSSITGATALAEPPADTDEFVFSDNGTLKRIDFAHMRSSFDNVAFSARLDTNVTMSDATDTTIVFNTEILDTDSAYDNSTGIYTLPVTGKYLVGFNLMFADAEGNIDDFNAKLDIEGTTQEVVRAQSTSNGTLFTKKTLSYVTILPSGNATDTLKVVAFNDTTNGSTSLVQGAGYSGVFWGVRLRD